jgi:hypothetical protein
VEKIMLNFFNWTNNNYEIVMEKYSFYFSHKMCVAFRTANSGGIVHVRGLEKFGYFPYASGDFLNKLKHCGTFNYLPEDEFKHYLDIAYSRALLTGIRRVGLDKLFNCDSKEIENVTDRKSNAG